MNGSTKQIGMTTTLTTDEAMALQMATAERLEQAHTEVRIQSIRIQMYDGDMPMALKISAVGTYRRAAAELDAAQAAFDAAQDLDCPEE